jgi:hypothetical protein
MVNPRCTPCHFVVMICSGVVLIAGVENQSHWSGSEVNESNLTQIQSRVNPLND